MPLTIDAPTEERTRSSSPSSPSSQIRGLLSRCLMNRVCVGVGCASSSMLQITGLISRPSSLASPPSSLLRRRRSIEPTRNRSMSLPSLSRPDAYEPKRNASWTPGIPANVRRRCSAGPVVRRMTSRSAGTSAPPRAMDHRRRFPRRRLSTTPALMSCSRARWTGWASALTLRAISRV